MVHPDTELRFVSPAIGWGVFATRDIPTGTITWALDALDQHLSDKDIRRLPEYDRELVEEYAYIDGRGDHILCWDHARFNNHSCDANCLGVCDDFQMAVRDIAAGEEVPKTMGRSIRVSVSRSTVRAARRNVVARCCRTITYGLEANG